MASKKLTVSERVANAESNLLCADRDLLHAASKLQPGFGWDQLATQSELRRAARRYSAGVDRLSRSRA